MPLFARLCIVAIALFFTASAGAADFFFKDGDVVVMIGDSITEQHLYSNFVEMWTVTRFPNWKLTFRNVGIGGDRSVGGNSRFGRDVLLHKPTAMTVDFGMNDGGYRAFGDDTFKPYMDGLQGMASQAKVANIRTAWCTPQPLDTGDQGQTALVEYNQTLEKFSAGVKEISDKNGGLFVDQFHPYLAALDRARGQGSKYERITGGDAVHPGPPGQRLTAASILKGLSFPSLVSSAEIDAAGSKAAATKNCTVENVVAKEGGVSFSRLDGALPFFPADATGILPWVCRILDELNDYRLKVTGLAAGKYEVGIGGKRVIAEADGRTARRRSEHRHGGFARRSDRRSSQSRPCGGREQEQVPPRPDFPRRRALQQFSGLGRRTYLARTTGRPQKGRRRRTVSQTCCLMRSGPNR